MVINIKDGILIIDKPKDYTSHDVVAKCRKILQTKKIGHTGTLDPMATGVLVLCIGAATKMVEYLSCDDKIYDVEMKLGIKTDTGDNTGKMIDSQDFKKAMPLEKEFWNSFIGKQIQVPPMYSAIKKDGIKLYELARKGLEVERESRSIEIFSISNIVEINEIIKFRVHCSKGTYIRVLCEDIAKKIGTIGVMTSLRRVKSGRFDISEACDLEDVSEEKILPMENILSNNIFILESELYKLLNGVELKRELGDGYYNLYCDNKYIGVGFVNNNILKRQ